MKFKIVLVFFLLMSCSSFEEAGKALRNEKLKSTDEFLIEKRGPLTIPPDMNELPRPNTKKKVEKNKNIFGVKNSEEINSDESSRIEKILLEEIKNN